MHTEKILRKAGLLAASGVVALALAALPVAPGLDAGSVDLKAAQAKGNGNGNGNGGGSANGGGNGNSGNAGNGGGTASAGAGNQGNGHGNGVSTENDGLDAQSHGLTASSLEGLNAGHASIQGFANANETSMVGQIGLAVQAAFEDELEGVEEDGLISTVDPDEVNAGTLAANLEIDEDVAISLKGLVDDKIEGGPVAE